MPARTGVLIVAPHPDDEVFGCGGTIRLLSISGVPVDVLFMTRGEKGVQEAEVVSPESMQRLACIRTAEANRSCEILGVREVKFLNGQDCNLHNQFHLAGDLLNVLHGGCYNRVFCPWPMDEHTDHQATFKILRLALKEYPESLDVWLYEIWSPLRPSICIPVDTTVDDKMEAMRAHRSQLECLNYYSAFLGLASYRSLLCPTSKYAEAFLIGTREWAIALGEDPS